MENIENSLLKQFGEKMIKTARDLTIKEERRILNGEAKSPFGKKLHSRLEGLRPEHKEAIEELLIDAVDGALNNFLWIIEQEEEFDLIAYTENKDKFVSLKETCDGLCGEYWNFVDTYSQHKRLDD